MNINFSNDFIDEGFFGSVFCIKNNRVIKLFKLPETKKDEERYEKVFTSEIEAYEAIQSDSELKAITPKFFGTVKVCNVLDNEKNDLTSKYKTNCAYIMSYEKGKFIKIKSPLVPKEEFNRIKKLFEKYGVEYIDDASVILDENRKIKMVIDFTMKYYEAWY